MTVDLDIDERATLSVKFNVINPAGQPRDITGAAIVWNATRNGVVELEKSTDAATIVLGTPENGYIYYFTLVIGKTDIDLPSTATYGVAVIYKHEARIALMNSEYVEIRGRMFVWPSQTEI